MIAEHIFAQERMAHAQSQAEYLRLRRQLRGPLRNRAARVLRRVATGLDPQADGAAVARPATPTDLDLAA